MYLIFQDKLQHAAYFITFVTFMGKPFSEDWLPDLYHMMSTKCLVQTAVVLVWK